MSTLSTLIFLPSKPKLGTDFRVRLRPDDLHEHPRLYVCLLLHHASNSRTGSVKLRLPSPSFDCYITVPRLQPMHDGASEAWGAVEGDRRQWSLPRKRSNDTWFETLWRSQTAEGIIFRKSSWHTPRVHIPFLLCLFDQIAKASDSGVHSYCSGRHCIPRTVNKFNLSWNVMGGLFSSTKLALLLRTCHQNFVAPRPAWCAAADSYDT